MGTVVQATNLDSVRIEVLGESRAVTIPVTLLLAADRVLRVLHGANVGGNRLVVAPAFADDPPREIWEAQIGGVVGAGETPWGAVASLADELYKVRR